MDCTCISSFLNTVKSRAKSRKTITVDICERKTACLEVMFLVTDVNPNVNRTMS